MTSLAMPALAAPALTSAESRVERGGTPVALALAGPVTTEPREMTGASLHVGLAFDRPLLGYRRIEVTGGELAGIAFTSGNTRIDTLVTGVRDATGVTVRIVDAVSESGIADAEARVLVFEGDFDGDGVRSLDDVLNFFDDNTPPRPAEADANPGTFSGPAKGDPVRRLIARPVATMPNIAPTLEFVGERDDERMMPRFAPPGGTSLPIPIRLRDDRTPEGLLTIQAHSTNTTVVADADIVIEGTGANRVVRFTGASNASGTAQIVLTVDDGVTTSEHRFVASVQANTAPEAIALTDTFVGPAPLIVAFDATESFDAQNNIVSYAWDFAGLATTAAPKPVFAFQKPGTYEVTLTVFDINGLSDSVTRTITVADQPWSPGAPGTPVTESEARRFLWQAAFGPSDEDVAYVMANGYEAWLDDQLTKTPSYVLRAYREQAQELNYPAGGESIWQGITVSAPDQLRQRIAWALSQIFAMRENNDEYETYSLFIKNALPDPALNSAGNFRGMLSDITYDVNMGEWLTYRNNRKADPAAGTLPDQNYAREIQQLFAIGLWELHADGSQLTDLFGEPIPAYDQTDIEQFSRVFTGLGSNYPERVMTMRDNHHEFGETFLHDYMGAVPAGGYLPASEQSDEEAYINIEQALDNLFYHPTSAPFLAEQFIKRTTVSNPSPAYVQRVTRAYEGLPPFGNGTRGDLFATFKAILLDDEARNPAYRTNPFYGKTQEPIVMRAGTHRAIDSIEHRDRPFPFQMTFGSQSGTYEDFGQAFMYSPSVFNFYSPDDAPLNTPISAAGLVAPELEIHDDNTALESLGEFDDLCRTDQLTPERYAELVALSTDPDALVDWAVRVIRFDAIDPAVRQIIVDAVADTTNNNASTQADRRIRLAIGLVVLDPGFRHLR